MAEFEYTEIGGDQCCANCGNHYELMKFDYTRSGECTKMDGFICMAFQKDGIASWMYGDDENIGMCEAWCSKGG